MSGAGGKMTFDNIENGGERMNDNELKRFRDYANHYQGSDVAMLMEHIDTQAKRIVELESAYSIFIESNKKIMIFEKKQIDGILAALSMYEEIEKQIAALKAALINERMRDNYSCIRMDQVENEFGFIGWHRVKLTHDESASQLAREMPEIDWEDMK